ncbi:alpha/beta fold hydrolase [Spirosoma validum]|uniref:Alpha/beta fold hydrolase n=1 Tax=Spirosoma validum TaxID=2771355 RepID=A0A927GDV3_9BACT|nr:alpha/beta fold hydrolase [Spirosoma validum]MBD2754119.1 alpha/beta fold hydrolase [Spirosoma validum]
MTMQYSRLGTGKPLLLIHGIGSSHRSWDRISNALASERDVIALDLPGFGATPPLTGEVSIKTMADAVTEFLQENDLIGIDAVGSSMGARLVLELARRGGVLGAVVSLDPGGFWQGWEIPFFYHSVRLSAQLVDRLQPILPALTGNPITRTLLFAQFSARPWQLPAEIALNELRTFVPTPTFNELLDNLAHGEKQKGAPRGSIQQPLVIGWGRQDLVCLPSQSKLALQLFPDASLHWFDHSGHFPQLDVPEQATQLILDVTDGTYKPQSKPIRSEETDQKTEQPVHVLAGAAIVAATIVAILVTFRFTRDRF